MLSKKKIEIIVYDQGIIGSFMEGLKQNSLFSFPIEENFPDEVSKRMSKARAIYEFENFDLIVRCLEDIMPPYHENIYETNKKNSKEQYDLLCGYLEFDSPDLIITENSASSSLEIQENSKDISCNGSIYIGAEYFMFDGKKYDKNSISDLIPNVYTASTVKSNIFNIFSEEEKEKIVSNFKTPPNFPANPLTLNINKDYVCNTTINITDNSLFNITNDAALEEAAKIFGKEKKIICFDNLNGVVNMAAIEASTKLEKMINTLFISAILSRFNNYEQDVDSEEVQEKVVSFNAGVAASFLVKKIGENLDMYI